MFVARERELAALERMYKRDGFQMAVIYGRRRVGKTTLIDEFVKDKRVLYFTAQQKTSHQNLELLSAATYAAFSLPATLPAFASWNDALRFVVERVGKEPPDTPLVIVFDEFPYAAEADPSLPSTLQATIDHGLKQTDTKLILCGSNEGFMESRVLGSKSPLYGRRTMQMRLNPFDYLDAARMLPGVPPEELVIYYATFGGTPYYLSQVDLSRTYEENVRELFFDRLGLLYEEPLMLLRQELFEPASYNSILRAIAGGANFKGTYPVVLPVNFVSHNAYRGLPDSSTPWTYDGNAVNWPYITKCGVNWGNDYPGKYGWEGKRGLPTGYLENLDLRRKVERDALIKTLHYIYYMQNELGENWSVADDEYRHPILPRAAEGLPDEWLEIVRRMPAIPYVRESRRIVGNYTLTSSELLKNSLSIVILCFL